MNLSVTIHATVAHVVGTWGLRTCASRINPAQATLITCGVRANRCATGMRTVMAFLTHERWACLKQWGDIGTVWCMAIRAVFHRRLMLEQEWAAFFRMAGKTSFIHGVFLEQFRTGRAVRIMAI